MTIAASGGLASAVHAIGGHNRTLALDGSERVGRPGRIDRDVAGRHWHDLTATAIS